jgi:hypothetical protein
LLSVLDRAIAAVNGEVGEPQFNVYDNHLTKSQLAKAIGRSSRTLDNWHRDRIGPPRIKFGGTILYNLDSFRQWLAAQELPHGVRAKPPRLRPPQQQKRPRGRPRKQPPTAAAE